MILTGTGIIRGLGPQDIPKIVVAGSDGGIIYSDDLVTWQGATTPHGSDVSYLYGAVTYSPQRRQFIATYTTGPTSTTLINTSNNGKTWIEQVNPSNSGTDWTGLAWSPTLRLYATCSNTGNNQYNFMTSPDGVNWTNRAAPSFSGNYYGYNKIIWSVSSSAFIAISTGGFAGASAANSSAYSTDGITWTANSSSAIFATAIAEGDSSLGAGKHVKVWKLTSNNNKVASASNVTSTWTDRSATMTSVTYNWSGVAWSPSLGLYCAVSTYGVDYGCKHVILSSDGINWTRYATGINNINLSAIAWSASLGKFIAVGGGISPYTTTMMVSTNGTTWSTITAPAGEWSSIVATS